MTVPLKYRVKVIAGQSPDSAEVFDNGKVPFIQGCGEFGALNPQPVKYCDSAPKRAQFGDVLLSVRAPVGATNVALFDLGIGRGVAALRPFTTTHRRYLYWYIVSAARDLSAAATGSTFESVTATDIGSLRVPDFEVPNQERIANFLDEKTARIDALIAEKERLLQRLDELGASQIASRILGHNLGIKRTPTNVSEVGSIPSGWNLVPMMRLTDPKRPIMYGIVLPGPNVEDGPSVPIVKGGDVRPHRLRLELLNRTTREIEAPYARARLAPGDTVYSIRGTIGDAELVPAELEGANITQDVARIAPREGVHPRWLMYAAKSSPVFAQLEQLSLGAAVRGINIWDLKRARVPTPPPNIQRDIAGQLDELVARLDELKAHSTVHIARLVEYRASLVTAAVTGRVEPSGHRVS